MRTLLTLALFGAGLSACSGGTPGDRDTNGEDTGVDDTDGDDTDGEDTGGEDTDGEDTGGEEICDGSETVQLMACVAWDGEDPDGLPFDPVSLSVAGTVSEVGSGDGAGCSYQDMLIGDARAAWLDDVEWLRIIDAEGTTWTVSMRAPGVTVPEVGDEVALEVDYTPLAWESTGDFTSGHILVTDREGGILVWVGGELVAEDLTGPGGVVLTTGAQACEEDHKCGTIRHFDVQATVGSESVTLEPGGSGEVDGLRFTLGDSVVYYSNGECWDWNGAWVIAAAVPAP